MPTFFLAAVCCLAPPADGARIYDCQADADVTLDALVEDLARRDVIFLGEDHDNAAGHRQQLAILKALHGKRPDLVLSLEMFERDVQGALDDYLRGRIDEAAFLKHARPWNEYAAHYRPLVEFAREHRLDVLAANVPRAASRAISKGELVPRPLRPFLPRETTAPEDEYLERFVEVMKEHAGTNEPEAMQRFYRSQCLKDDAMAEAITDYLSRAPHRRPLIVHLCGKFHSDYGLGTAQRVQSRRPLALLGVVSMEAADTPKTLDVGPHRARGHYLLVLPAETTNKNPPAAPVANGKKP